MGWNVICLENGHRKHLFLSFVLSQTGMDQGPIGFIFPFWFCLFLSQWKGEIQEFCPNTKMLLVGCKSDRRTDLTTLVELSNHRQTPVSYDQVSGSHKLLLQFGWMPVRHSTLA